MDEINYESPSTEVGLRQSKGNSLVKSFDVPAVGRGSSQSAKLRGGGRHEVTFYLRG
jgi:hypothetical protein